MMSKLHPCLRAIPSARGTFGISMKPKRMRTRAENALHRQAAQMLRRKGYQRRIVMLSSDDALPYDRPNLSKDYLAGAIPFDFVPLRDEGFYEENGIETHLGQAALEIDVRAREVVLASGKKVPYDRLLLATGAERVRLTIPGAFEKKRLRRPWRRGKAQDHGLSDPNPSAPAPETYRRCGEPLFSRRRSPQSR